MLAEGSLKTPGAIDCTPYFALPFPTRFNIRTRAMPYPALTAVPMPDWNQLAAVPVAECGAPLLPVPETPRLRVRAAYFEMGIAGAMKQILLREPVIERLLAALDALPECCGIEVLDGWRPVSVQAALREQFRGAIVARHPEYGEEQIQAALDQFVANPYRKDMSPPHLSGGSVDLTLFDTAGRQALDMGTAFDEPSHLSHTRALETEPHPRYAGARQNRRLLVHAMLGAGFTNLPSEWWHFDYGNQNWAFFSGAPAAFFGAAEHPQAA